MKATGIVRPTDRVGRIVLPVELRKNLKINVGDSLEIFTEEDKILLRKYEPMCIFCEEARNLRAYEGKNICLNCIEKIKNVT